MGRRVRWAVVALLLEAAALSGCGDDDALEDRDRSADAGPRDGSGDSGGDPVAAHGGGPGGAGAGADGAGADGADVRGGAGGSAADGGTAGRRAADPESAGAGAGGESPREPAIQCGDAACEPLPDGFVRACCADASTGSCGLSVIGGPCTTPRHDDLGCPDVNFGNILVLPSCCTSEGMCGVDTSSVGRLGCLDLESAAERARLAGASAAFPAPRACDLVGEDAGVADDAADAGPTFASVGLGRRGC
jgi:hypothetical protein